MGGVRLGAGGEFRFDSIAHEYLDLTTGEVIPHITGLLEQAGWVDDTWYTEESCERGHEVHRLTADYDLGAIEDPAAVTNIYKGWLLAHVAMMRALKPQVLKVEEPEVHPTHRFGGRIDRVIKWSGMRGPMEIKSGAPAPSHRIQTALQAILDSVESRIIPHQELRLAAYVKGDGKWKVEQHQDRRDFDEAFRILRLYGRAA